MSIQKYKFYSKILYQFYGIKHKKYNLYAMNINKANIYSNIRCNFYKANIYKFRHFVYYKLLNKIKDLKIILYKYKI